MRRWQILFGVAALVLVTDLAAKEGSPQPSFADVCPAGNPEYCANVGKRAVNNFMNPKLLQGIDLGKINGVAWRPEGSVIGVSAAIPSAGIKKEVRLSPRNAFYYIIDDGAGKPFLRQCVEIQAK